MSTKIILLVGKLFLTVTVFIDATCRSINGRWYGGLGFFSIPLFEYTLRTVMAAGADVARRTQKVRDEHLLEKSPGWVKICIQFFCADVARRTQKVRDEHLLAKNPWWVKICIHFFYIHSLHIDTDHISALTYTHGTRLVFGKTYTFQMLVRKHLKLYWKWYTVFIKVHSLFCPLERW